MALPKNYANSYAFVMLDDANGSAVAVIRQFIYFHPTCIPPDDAEPK